MTQVILTVSIYITILKYNSYDQNISKNNSILSIIYRRQKWFTRIQWDGWPTTKRKSRGRWSDES